MTIFQRQLLTMHVSTYITTHDTDNDRTSMSIQRQGHLDAPRLEESSSSIFGILQEEMPKSPFSGLCPSRTSTPHGTELRHEISRHY